MADAPGTASKELTPTQKAAVALVVMGREVAAEVVKNLSQREIEKLTVEIANLPEVSPTREENVIKEGHTIFMARQYIAQGGIEYARGLLEEALGKNKAVEILSNLEGSLHKTGFDMLKNIEPRQLTNFIQNEHPQTISLLLTQLTAQHAAAVLAELSAELQAEVTLRLATMEKISPEILHQLEEVLETQFDTGQSRDLSVSGGVKTVADILNIIDTTTERRIMKILEAEDAQLANQIKNMMFVFEDLVLLDDRRGERIPRTDASVGRRRRPAAHCRGCPPA
ncbi:MAG: flagellar motor switch protein FliG [candidate division Zixibacteria bacterium]|nr:flagellar motor switch protein FliG [candidate division Zixibacteria bacterium]